MTYVSPTPKPPYYAVVFTSINADTDHAEHEAMSARMLELAGGYDGFLGIEPARDPEHLIAKEKGRTLWYEHYMIRVARVERDYGRPD